MRITSYILCILAVLVLVLSASAAQYSINGSTSVWPNTDFTNATTNGNDSNNIVVGIQSDYFNRANNSTIGGLWVRHVSDTSAIENNKLKITSNSYNTYYNYNFTAQPNISFSYGENDSDFSDSDKRFRIGFFTQSGTTTYWTPGYYLVFYPFYGTIRLKRDTDVQIGSTVTGKFFNSTDVITVVTASMSSGLKLYKNGILWHTFDTGNSSYSNGYIYFSAGDGANPAPQYFLVDNFRVWDTTWGTATSWYDSGAGQEIKTVSANLTAPQTTNMSLFYKDNSSGTWVASSSQNVTANTTFSVPAGIQNIDIKVELNGNLSASPELSQIIFEYDGEDSTVPTYSGQNVNQTVANASTNFTIVYNDNIALHPNGQWMFSTNNSGEWINSSWSNFTSTPQTIYNNTLILNSTVGTTVGYRFYAKDNNSNYNNTSIFTVVTTAQDVNCTDVGSDGVENEIITVGAGSNCTTDGIDDQVQINYANENATDGQTIQLIGSSYNISIGINKSIGYNWPSTPTLLNWGIFIDNKKNISIIGTSSIINTSNYSLDFIFGLQNSTNITFKNITFQSLQSSRGTFKDMCLAGCQGIWSTGTIFMFNASNITFNNNSIQGGGSAIYGANVFSSIITNNFLDCYICWDVGGMSSMGTTTTDNVISNNTFSMKYQDGGYSIRFEGASYRNIIRDNMITGISQADAVLELYSSTNNNTVNNNTIIGNDAKVGIRINDYGNYNTISYNNITGIRDEPISIKAQANQTMTNNSIIGNIINNTISPYNGSFWGDVVGGISIFTTANTTELTLNNCKIEGNTIVNSYNGISFHYKVSAGDCIIKNNIIINQSHAGIYNQSGAGIVLTTSYNNLWNNTINFNGSFTGNNNISQNPLFASSTDFHLKSQAGRWNGTAWVTDSVTSPAIDAGDPTSDYSNEPAPNGSRINMGAYGNTIYASKSFSEGDFVPPAPTNLTNTQGNFWINYTWLPGIGNTSDSYNVSVNGIWTNGTTVNYSYTTLNRSQWGNITIYAWNNSGSGTLSLTALSGSVQMNSTGNTRNPAIAVGVAKLGNQVSISIRSFMQRMGRKIFVTAPLYYKVDKYDRRK